MIDGLSPRPFPPCVRSVPFRSVPRCVFSIPPSWVLPAAPSWSSGGKGGGKGQGVGETLSLPTHSRPAAPSLSVRCLPAVPPPSRLLGPGLGLGGMRCAPPSLSFSLCQFSSPENEEGRDNGGGYPGRIYCIIYPRAWRGTGSWLGRTESWGKFIFYSGSGRGEVFRSGRLVSSPPHRPGTDSPLEGT